ncbi:MAG: glycosyltransferase family 39 protein [Candidatus Woesebacteria bacterium]|nr:MAG: glycosyltransferase family 39 protein [Candidatus Woesebacteria bacterium]
MKKYVLLLILTLAAVLRLLTLPRLMVFTPDEEYLVYIAQTLIKHFHIIWIGVSALGLDFYMGPFWIYIISPFLSIAHGDPLVLGVMTSLIGVGTSFLLYVVGGKLFNRKVGLIAALLYASSSLLVYYDQQPYPPAVSFLSLLMFFALYKTKFSNKWWIVFSILYGFVFHIHLSLFLIIFVAIYWAYLRKRVLNKKVIILSIVSFLVTISPLIFFDYFHKASNVTVVFRIIQTFGKSKTSVDVGTRVNNLAQAFGRIFYLKPERNNADEILYPCIIDPLSTTTKLNLIFCSVILIFFLSFFTKKDVWRDERKRLILLFSLAFLIPFLFMKIFNPIEYYLLGFFPIMILAISVKLTNFNKNLRPVLYFIVLFLVLHGIYTVLVARGDYGVNSKKVLINKVMEVVGNEPYELSEAGACHGYEGFRYLFSAYGKRPARSSEDSNFSWLWRDEVSNTPVKYKVLITETRANVVAPLDYKEKISEGGFTAYVYLSLK